jgi:hypothetical protein
MKKNLFIIAFAIAFNCCAQKSGTPTFSLPRNLVKLSPFQLFTNTLELGIESFNPSYSKSFQVSLGLRSGSVYYYTGKGASLEFAYRKYAAPMKFYNRKQREFYQGIYYSLFLNSAYFKGRDTYYSYYNPNGSTNTLVDFSDQIWSIAPGFTIGFERTLWKVLVLDVFVGGGIRFTDVQRKGTMPYSNGYEITDPGYEGIFPKIGAKIGVGL